MSEAPQISVADDDDLEETARLQAMVDEARAADSVANGRLRPPRES